MSEVKGMPASITWDYGENCCYIYLRVNNSSFPIGKGTTKLEALRQAEKTLRNSLQTVIQKLRDE